MWTRENFSDVATDLDVVWGAYGDLEYNGLDGNRAREAVEAMERIIRAIEKRTNIRFG